MGRQTRQTDCLPIGWSVKFIVMGKQLKALRRTTQPGSSFKITLAVGEWTDGGKINSK